MSGVSPVPGGAVEASPTGARDGVRGVAQTLRPPAAFLPGRRGLDAPHYSGRVIDRRALGGWLQGPGTAPSDGRPGGRQADDGEHAGARFGRPATGSGSVAGFGRRLAALGVDWAFALLIAGGVMRPLGLGQFAPLVALFLMHAVLVGVAGFTVGHRLLGLRVDRIDQPVDAAGPRLPPGLLSGLVRAVLLCLAVPPLVMDSSGRGLHDRLSGTIVVRR